MDQVQILDKTFVKYIEKKDIDAACEKMAGQINEDYKNDEPILLATLNGAIIFAAELMQKLTIRCRISCIKLSSYCGTTSTNQVKQLVGLNEDISGKRVIIVEDIVDTGVTYEHMVALLKEAKVKDIAMATMAFKPTAYKKDIPVQYVGFSIPDKFVIGHGLDYDGWGRNLPDIYQLKTEN